MGNSSLLVASSSNGRYQLGSGVNRSSAAPAGDQAAVDHRDLQQQGGISATLRCRSESVGFGLVIEPHLDSEILIGGIGMLEIASLLRQVLHPEAAVFNIAVDLIGVGAAAAFSIAVSTETGAGRYWACVHDGSCNQHNREFRAAVFVDHSGQTKPCAEIKQHGLEAADITIRCDHRPADGISNSVRLTDRPVEQRDAVMRSR